MARKGGAEGRGRAERQKHRRDPWGGGRYGADQRGAAGGQIKRYEDNNTTLSAYLSGQVQYVATGNLVVAAISRQNADKAPVPSFMLKDSPCFIGLKKNEPALKAKVDTLIEQGIKDGTLNGLSEQWLKAPLPASLGA